MSNPATRRFKNEVGNMIAIMVRAGPSGRNVFCRVAIKGPSTSVQNNMTRMELEQLRDAIVEALAHGESAVEGEA